MLISQVYFSSTGSGSTPCDLWFEAKSEKRYKTVLHSSSSSLVCLATVWKERTKDFAYNRCLRYETDTQDGSEENLQIKVTEYPSLSDAMKQNQPGLHSQRERERDGEGSFREGSKIQYSLWAEDKQVVHTLQRALGKPEFKAYGTEHNVARILWRDRTTNTRHCSKSRSWFRGRAYRVHSRAVGRPASSQTGRDVGEPVLTAHGVPVCFGTLTACVARR